MLRLLALIDCLKNCSLLWTLNLSNQSIIRQQCKLNTYRQLSTLMSSMKLFRISFRSEKKRRIINIKQYIILNDVSNNSKQSKSINHLESNFSPLNVGRSSNNDLYLYYELLKNFITLIILINF